MAVSVCFELEYHAQDQAIGKIHQKDMSMYTYPQLCRGISSSIARPSFIASYMRKLLNGDIITTDDESRSIAILTGTWFLAETGRNPLTFMITLMMLDLIEHRLPYNTDRQNPKYYTWDQVVWNPAILYNRLSSDQREEQFPQEEGWGGKHPMCHGGSYFRLFKNNRFPEISKSLGQVRQKEGTILINWLSHALRDLPEVSDIEIITLKGKSRPSKTWKQKQTFFVYEINEGEDINTPLKQKIINETIKPLLQRRLDTFECQLGAVVSAAPSYIV